MGLLLIVDKYGAKDVQESVIFEEQNVEVRRVVTPERDHEARRSRVGIRRVGMSERNRGARG